MRPCGIHQPTDRSLIEGPVYRRPLNEECRTGLLKRYILPILKHDFFNTKIEGHHHLQGNVQVYNVRIPLEGPGVQPPQTDPNHAPIALPPHSAWSCSTFGTRSLKQENAPNQDLQSEPCANFQGNLHSPWPLKNGVITQKKGVMTKHFSEGDSRYLIWDPNPNHAPIFPTNGGGTSPTKP